ncbi:MAG: BamA/TamA family outer membrane protein [Microcoleaceae cyanobacterium]
MRLSPILVAVVAVSATFGISRAANGQISEVNAQHSSELIGGSNTVALPLQKSKVRAEAVIALQKPQVSKSSYSDSIDSSAKVVRLKSKDALEPTIELSLDQWNFQKSSLSTGKKSERLSLSKSGDFKVQIEAKEQSLNPSKAKQSIGRLALNPPLFEQDLADELFVLNKAKSESQPLADQSSDLELGKPDLGKPELVKLDLSKSDAAKLGELFVQANPENPVPQVSPQDPIPQVNPQDAVPGVNAPEIIPGVNPPDAVPQVDPQDPVPQVNPQIDSPNTVPGSVPETVPAPEPTEPEGSPGLPPDLGPERPVPGTRPRPPAPQAAPEPQVLVAEVVVAGVDDPKVEEQVYSAISTRPGLTTTRAQLQRDINAIFAIGLFRNVRAVPEDTPLGVRVTFEVEPNPPLQAVVVEGDEALPQEVIDAAFADQIGKAINLNQVEAAIEKINTWYQENGFVLAQVVAAPEVTPEGTVTLKVAEGVIESIRVRYLNRDGEPTDEEGKPIEGNTREFIITREIELQPGDVFNQQKAQQDLSRVFGLGIFEDVRLELEPGAEDPQKAVMIVNVIERSTGSLALGGGVSSATGLFGTVSYQEQNLGGNNQRLGTEIQLGEDILLLDLNFTDPWIAGDPYRTSYTVNVFRRRAISVIFEAGEDEDDEVRLPNGDRIRIIRTGGGVTFTRPFAESPYVDPDFVTSLGVQYQRVQAADAENGITPRDELGKLLTASESGEDDLFTVQFGIAQDRRNNTQFPTSGYTYRLGTEQSIPIGSGSIFYNRLRGSYNFFIPVSILEFIPDAPQTLAFSFQAGTIIGDFPPYEAFPLGGSNTVRGWREGALGVARSFVLGSVEYRFPIFSIGNFLIGGALFFDAATALDSQGTVQGNPGGIRGKPGSGIGFGGGLRVQSPLGPIRIDYGINNLGEGRIHFGIGERF